MTWAEHLELVLRLLAGAVLGAAVGYERARHHHPAGLRTHALVGLASATVMVVSAHFFRFQGYAPHQLGAFDPSKIASSVVAGIGFLAGGAILRHGLTVQGLTTAAGLWLVAALGLAAGAGMYVEAVVATAIGEVVLVVVQRLESRSLRRRLDLTLDPGGPSIDEVTSLLTSLGVEVERREYERDASGTRQLALELNVTSSPVLEKARLALEAQSGISRLRFEAL